jgi:hypothetical protein
MGIVNFMAQNGRPVVNDPFVGKLYHLGQKSRVWFAFK